MADPKIHPGLEWLDKAVPGFAWTYRHNAEFHLIVDNTLHMLLHQMELMAIGGNERERRASQAVKLLERTPGLTADEAVRRVVADSERGMLRGE